MKVYKYVKKTSDLVVDRNSMINEYKYCANLECNISNGKWNMKFKLMKKYQNI